MVRSMCGSCEEGAWWWLQQASKTGQRLRGLSPVRGARVKPRRFVLTAQFVTITQAVVATGMMAAMAAVMSESRMVLAAMAGVVYFARPTP